MRSSPPHEARIDLALLSSGRRTRPSIFPCLFFSAGPLRAGHPATAASGFLPGDVSFSKRSHIRGLARPGEFFAIEIQVNLLLPTIRPGNFPADSEEPRDPRFFRSLHTSPSCGGHYEIIFRSTASIAGSRCGSQDEAPAGDDYSFCRVRRRRHPKWPRDRSIGRSINRRVLKRTGSLGELISIEAAR